MAWFLQMWAAAALLNGRLLRENALQGAEQLEAETIRGLEWEALSLQGTGRHLLSGSVSGALAGQEAKGRHPQEGSISFPAFLSLALSPSTVLHPGWPGDEEHRFWGLTSGPHSVGVKLWACY